jgi:hypothetical protein
MMAASWAMSSPAGDPRREGAYTILITNNTSVAPLHVHPRLVFSDAAGTSTTVAHAIALVSTTQAFGFSAPQVQTGFILLSGQNVAFPLEFLAGSVLQIWLIAASNTASTVYISGAITIWKT